MSPELLSLILWIPFLLTVIIAGLVHCISGYKRGLWRALISLGAVVVSTVISIFAARLLAKVLTPVVMNLLPLDSFGEGVSAGMISMLAGSLVSMVLSIVLFGVVMFIISIILHIVSVKVQKDKLVATSKKMKFFGMGVGVVSAVLFACVWLSPVYGSLATVVPLAETVINMQESEDASDSFVAQCINSIKSHPIVKVSESGPVSVVYSSISYLSVNNASVSIVDMSNAIEEVTALVEELKGIDDPSDIAPIAAELIGIVKDTLVEQGWVYSFAQEIVTEAKKSEEVGAILEDPIVSELLEILEAPEGVFKENVVAILDFAQYALENDVIKALEEEDMGMLYSSGIIQEAGKLANVSDESVKVKRLLMTALLSDVFDGDAEKAQSFIDKYALGKTMGAEEQLAEAEAILVAVFDGSVAEAIMRHPAFGEAAVEELFESGNIAQLIGFGNYEEEVEEFLKNDRKGKDKIISELKKSSNAQIDESAFEEAMYDLLGIEYVQAAPGLDSAVGGDGKFEVEFGGEDGGDYIIYGPDGEKLTGTVIGGEVDGALDGIYEIIIGEDGSYQVVVGG